MDNLTPTMLKQLWHFRTIFVSPQNPKTVHKTSSMGLHFLMNQQNLLLIPGSVPSAF